MWIIGALFKGLVSLTGIVGKLTDAKVIATQVDGEIRVAAIQADVEMAKIRKDLLIAYQGWWVTRWIVPCIAYPLIAWWGCVIYDSIFQDPKFSVARLPDPLMDWAGTILLSFFLVSSIEKIVSPVRNTIGSLLTSIVTKKLGGKK